MGDPPAIGQLTAQEFFAQAPPDVVAAAMARVMGDLFRKPEDNAATTTPSGTTTTANTRREPSWKDMRHLDVTKRALIDNWFIMLESRLQAANTPKDRWVQQFMVCPYVSEKIKACRWGDKWPADHETLRKEVLQAYGPIEPVEFFLSQIFAVTGRTAEEVRDRLENLLTMHNRACDVLDRREEAHDA